MLNQHSRKNIAEIIKAIRTPADVLRVVTDTKDLAEGITSTMAKNLFAKSKRSFQLKRHESHIAVYPNAPPSPIYNQQAALILILPTELCPQEVLEWAYKLVIYLYNYEQVLASGILMRYAKAALITKQVENALTCLKYSSARACWAIPAYLYLHISIGRPIEFDLKKLSKYARIDCMTFFYLGMNLLLLKHYKKAFDCFLHALTLQMPSDFAAHIASHLAFVGFLLHMEFTQLRTLIESKIEINSEVMALFTEDDEIEALNFSYVANKLLEEIKNERIRRTIIRYYYSASEIPIKLLQKRVGDPEDFLQRLELLKDEKVIDFELQDDGFIMFKFVEIEEK